MKSIRVAALASCAVVATASAVNTWSLPQNTDAAGYAFRARANGFMDGLSFQGPATSGTTGYRFDGELWMSFARVPLQEGIIPNAVPLNWHDLRELSSLQLVSGVQQKVDGVEVGVYLIPDHYNRTGASADGLGLIHWDAPRYPGSIEIGRILPSEYEQMEGGFNAANESRNIVLDALPALRAAIDAGYLSADSQTFSVAFFPIEAEYYNEAQQAYDPGAVTPLSGRLWSFLLQSNTAALSLEWEALATTETIAYSGTPDAIDGIEDAAWEVSPERLIGNSLDSNAPTADTDLSGRFKVLQDGDFLYLLVTGMDQTPIDNTALINAGQFYLGDMVEIYLDLDGSGGTAYDGKFDYQLVVPRDDNPAFFAKGPDGAGLQIDDILIGKSVLAGAFAIEIAIPWQAAGINPLTLDSVGIDIYLKDSDNGANRRSQLAWSSTSPDAWHNPSVFGTVWLPGAWKGTIPPEEPPEEVPFLGIEPQPVVDWQYSGISWTTASHPGVVYLRDGFFATEYPEFSGWYHTPHDNIGWFYTTAEIWPWFYNAAIKEWMAYISAQSGYYRPSAGQTQRAPFLSQTLYVAPWGSDDGAGSFEAPYRTIAKATQQAAAGTKIYLREGEYTELLRPTRSGKPMMPIIYSAYVAEDGPERVVIAGTTAITPGANGFGEWERHEGDIWKISVPQNVHLLENRNQLFLDDELLRFARWPNDPDPLFPIREHLSVTEAVSNPPEANSATWEYRDDALAGFAEGAWTGGMVQLLAGKEFFRVNYAVQWSGDSSFRVQFTPVAEFQIPTNVDPYFLFGRLTALDDPGEFHFDIRGLDGPPRTLYVMLPDRGQPHGRDLSLRFREFGAQISNVSHIELRHLEFHAARIHTNSNANFLVFDGLKLIDAGFTTEPFGLTQSVIISGSHVTMKNSHIEGSTGSGILVNGSNATIENNVIARCYVNFQVENGPRHIVFRNNTVFDAGGSLVNAAVRGGDYAYNHVYRGGLLIADIGNINAVAIGDHEGLRIRYNWTHDGLSIFGPKSGHNGGFGIRMDGGAENLGVSNYILHHNVSWNHTHEDIRIWGGAFPAQPNYDDLKVGIYHNSVENRIGVGPGPGRAHARGVYVVNNLALGDINPLYDASNPDAVILRNFTRFAPLPGNFAGDPAIMDPQQPEFFLSLDSPAIDAGWVVPTISDSYYGTAPDIGAYEFGMPRWVPGARLLPHQIGHLQLVASGEGNVAGQTRYAVTGWPVGRKAPDGFVLRFGDRDFHPVVNHYDTGIHLQQVIFEIPVDRDINDARLSVTQWE